MDARKIEKVSRHLGELVRGLLSETDVIEVSRNPDGVVWVDRAGRDKEAAGTMPENEALALLQTLAGINTLELNEENPVIECVLPESGARFSGVIPPIVSGTTFAIRQRADRIFTLDDYITDDVLTMDEANIIRSFIAARKNIVVVGGTGSGKTTFVNALIDEMVKLTPEDRVVIIEDTNEIQCKAENAVQLLTSEHVSMSDLLRLSLRLSPKRILVGEVRSAEALDLIMSWNTGHSGGFATIHADSSEKGLSRIKSCISMNPNRPNPIEPLIGEAVNLLVFIAKTKNGRKIESILKVDGWNGKYLLTELRN